MKILNAKQLKEADDFTIKKQNITSVELMERAASQIFEWIHSRLQNAPVTIHIFCGVGNNGGDGLALARLLLKENYSVHVYIINFSTKRSTDFLVNYDRLKKMNVWPQVLNKEDELPAILKEDIVIDAIFGQGLNRPPVNWVATIIKGINNSNAFVVAVDIPSGLYMEAVPEDKNAVINTNYTLSLQLPKLPFFLPDTGVFTNDWEILDIGLDETFIQEISSDIYLIGKAEVINMYKPREKFSHKNTYGHVLVVGGSYGKIGAAMLSSEAALNSGAGLVTSYVPKCGYQIFQTALPEIMVLTCMHEEYISEIKYDIKPSVVALGMGLNIKPVTVKAFRSFLENIETPLVIDADGLNILAKEKDLIGKLAPKTILTPHPGELKRLIGEWKDDFEKIDKVKAFSKANDLIVVVKGAYTITVYHNEMYINTTGNPGMATAGSGDVLTGIIAGLVAQGYPPLNATIFGVYLHGKAGDLSVEKNSYQALTATEIIDYIGDAYLNLFERT
ncbi:bifunctional NAD(P)H-hydrate repair enzyme [Neptunitalea chrysea]|uniref:Bifunctional NAD(P)H-hydrate repair enzyme n=1 Tax=Neptunitalea chrysea TaxID=1647581 RepID=A0A9W6EVC9_9FLAO|nr:NAD(P)H-hydrate dehydratase [Neptunitalea chrysea]GLB52372.1 bifunctional NAD(P)H-hydrate repair enzyme [Neptunitalea chrysea]